MAFSGPPGEICPGDNVTFSCVANTTATVWSVSPEGADGRCEYLAFNRVESRCGPDERFRSFQSEGGDIFNSSLRVDSVTVELNETVVQCGTGPSSVVGSSSICIVGEGKSMQILKEGETTKIPTSISVHT